MGGKPGRRSSPSSLLCHLVTSMSALNARHEDASLLKPSLGMLLEHQSPVWWVGKSLWKDLHGTPTRPSGCDSQGTLLLYSESWFPPGYRGHGDYTPAPAEPGSQLGVMKMSGHLTHGREDSTVRDRTHCRPWEDDWLAWKGDSKATTKWAAGIQPQPPWAEHHAQRAVGTHKQTAVR